MESGAKWSGGGKKRKKGIGREEGFFPFLPYPQRFFSAAFVCTVPTTRTPGIGFSVASILGCGRKKIASHVDVFRGTSRVPAPSTKIVCVGGYKKEGQQNYDLRSYDQNRREIDMLLHHVHFPSIWLKQWVFCPLVCSLTDHFP